MTTINSCGGKFDIPCLDCNSSIVGSYQDIEDIYFRIYSGSGVGSKYICTANISSYSCPNTHPIKLNNSTCEYRENF